MKTGTRIQDRWLLLVSLLTILISFALTGCNTVQGTSNEAQAQTTTPVTVQLAWVNTAEYSSFHMAENKGYYAEEGLDVSLEELGEKSPVEQVVSGEATFGITSGDTLLLARTEGAPVVAIATLYQRSPVAFISLAEENITSPQDLIGKTVMVHFEGTTGIVYEAMLATQGIEMSQINNTPRTDFSNEPLLTGQVDVLDAFITNQPVQLAQQGIQTNAILPSDYGIDIYANTIFTSEDMIANNSELIERFLRATVRGIQAALDDPEGAAALTLTYNANLSLESETESMLRSLPLLNPVGSRPGMMTAENWEVTYQILSDQGLLSQEIDVNEAYNLSFLEKVHSQ